MSSLVIEKDLVIQNQKGLHARAAAAFVQSIKDFKAEIFVSRNGQKVGGDSIMGLMMLAASKGSQIHVEAQGPEAQKAIDTIVALVQSKFGEEL